MRQAGHIETDFCRFPFQLHKTQTNLLSNLEEWWFNQDQNKFLRIFSHPLNQISTIITIYYIIDKISNTKKQINFVYISDSFNRANFLLDLAHTLLNKYFNSKKIFQTPHLSSQYIRGKQNSQIVFTTFKKFITTDLPYQNIYHYMFAETGNFSRIVTDAFTDYITDTYLRRGYIEALKFQQAYRQMEKNITNKNINLNKKNSNDFPNIQLISLVSKQSQKKEANINNVQKKKIKNTYENKKQQLKGKNKKMKDQKQSMHFQQNELILISGIIYIIGFFYKLLQSKKIRNIRQFIQEYESKTFLTCSFIQNISKYYIQIYENCPTKIYSSLSETYLFQFCQFVEKITLYYKFFPDSYQQLFEIKVQSFPFQRRQTLIEQSSSCIIITCNENKKIFPKLIKQKSLNCAILQNIACPAEYWHYLFKTKNIYIVNEDHNNILPHIYGLNISKTASNEDLNFAQKLKPEIQTIKIKACGVLLHDLSKFIPDGIVVYFHSLEGLQSFLKEMQKQDEKILKKIDNNKKIFFQSVFEQQNNLNYLKYKKCCQIGRGGMFLMSANGKAAQNLKFYHHLSRCIVFFGLPKKQREFRKQIEYKKQLQVKQQNQIKLQGEFQKQSQEDSILNLQKILIYNQCINNCVNDISDYKSIIFVGRQITNDLQNWYKSFIKSWDQTTRQSLMKLRHHFQKMGSSNFTFK